MAACAVAVTLAVTASACSRSSDTTSLSADDDIEESTTSTTSAIRTQQTTTTAVPVAPVVNTVVPRSMDLTSTLGALVNQFAVDPSLLGQLNGLDLAGLAGLLNVDLASIEQLGLAIPDIAQIGQAVVASPPDLLAGIVGGGQIDPSALIGLLAGSIDLEALTTGAIGTLVSALLASIADFKVVISPELTVELSEILKNIDPEGLGSFAATPANAALLALITSAIIGSNPLLTEQLLDNPLLDPGLRGLLVDLQALGATLGDTATIALLQALDNLIPGGIPGWTPPGATATP
jgi:hypothetical protein